MKALPKEIQKQIKAHNDLKTFDQITNPSKAAKHLSSLNTAIEKAIQRLNTEKSVNKLLTLK